MKKLKKEIVTFEDLYEQFRSYAIRCARRYRDFDDAANMAMADDGLIHAWRYWKNEVNPKTQVYYGVVNTFRRLYVRQENNKKVIRRNTHFLVYTDQIGVENRDPRTLNNIVEPSITYDYESKLDAKRLAVKHERKIRKLLDDETTRGYKREIGLTLWRKLSVGKSL